MPTIRHIIVIIMCLLYARYHAYTNNDVPMIMPTSMPIIKIVPIIMHTVRPKIIMICLLYSCEHAYNNNDMHIIMHVIMPITIMMCIL